MSIKKSIQFITIIVLFASCNKQPTLSKEFPYNNSQYVLVDGVTLHYRTWINDSTNLKPWILLVHGFSGSTYTWNKNIDTLVSAGYNVVAVDVPPFGYSDKNRRTNQSVDSRANLLWHFTKEICQNERWILFGHSMGGDRKSVV